MNVKTKSMETLKMLSIAKLTLNRIEYANGQELIKLLRRYHTIQQALAA